MKLDLSELLRIPGSHVVYPLNEPGPSTLEVECVEPITGFLEFSSTSNLLFIRGRIQTVVRMECARCLQWTNTPINLEVEEEFRIRDFQVVASGDQPESQEWDENLLSIIRDQRLDLDEFLRQYVTLGLPIHPLCSVSCKGLCPYCGANLNEGECSCEPMVDSPFLALRSLFPETS